MLKRMWRKGNPSTWLTQLCLSLHDPMDCGLPGSSVHGIFQARILEWAAIPFSRDLPSPGIFPAQEMNPGLLHWRQILYHLSRHRSPPKSESCSVVSGSLRPHALCATRLLCPWNSPGTNIGVGGHSLLQEILTQGSNPGFLHCRQTLYYLSHQETELGSNLIK